MAEVRKYRVWCTTEVTYKYVWRDEVQGTPTACPDDPAHSIDTTKTTVVETSGVAQPTKEDGTPFVAVSPAKPGSPLYPIGIAKTFTLPQTEPVEIPYLLTELRHLNGAHGEVWGDFTPGENGDFIEFFIEAPDGQGGWVTVGQFGETLYFGPSGLIGPYISEVTTPVPAGCRFSTHYTAVGTSGTVNVVGWIRTYKEPT